MTDMTEDYDLFALFTSKVKEYDEKYVENIVYMMDKAYVGNHGNNLFHKNETVEQLLELYYDSDEKKVKQARMYLKDRFYCMSYDEQSKVIRTFLENGEDEEFDSVCEFMELEEHWDESYLPLIESRFIKYIERHTFQPYKVARMVIRHSSQEFILKAITLIDQQKECDNMREELLALLIACDKLPKEVLKNIVLEPVEYASVMCQKGQRLSEKEMAEVMNSVANASELIREDINIVIWLAVRWRYVKLVVDFAKNVRNRNEIIF